MNILLTPIGSHGDVHPFIGIGLALRRRGHRVRVIVNPFFESLVTRAGLEMIPLGTADYYRSMASNADLWKPVSGSKLVLQALGDLAEPVYDAIVANHEPGDTMVVASTMALGARVAQDKFGIPTVSVHLQPSVLRSTVQAETLPGMLFGPRSPRWILRTQWALADWLVIDRLAAPKLNAFRRQVGLPPVRGIMRNYIHSPLRVIGMFPPWFAPPQPDWPPQTRLTGFGLYDERGLEPLPLDLEKFLSDGSPPIAFTFGSAMWHAKELLEQSAGACTLLGRRGILLTRHQDNLPPRLPAGVRHFDFAPFSELLPRCAALVHHGGIGTAGQAMAAGVGQIILPHAHDQFDNAARINALGVGRMILPARYTADRAAHGLGDLLASGAVKSACRATSERFAGVDAIADACVLIEQAMKHAQNISEQT